MYCRKCGCRASTTGANFIKHLAQACQAPSVYGLDNLKRLRLGKPPRRVKHWPCDQFIDHDHDVIARTQSAPLSDFERQVLSDRPELSAAEAKVIADMLLRCAEYAAQVVPRHLADTRARPSSLLENRQAPVLCA